MDLKEVRYFIPPPDAWLATLGQLQLQFQRSTYDTWLRDSQFTAYDEATKTFTIQVRNDYAQTWLEQKLYRAIQETLSKIWGEPVTICFTAKKPAPHAVTEDTLPEPEGVEYWRQRALEAETRVQQLEHQRTTETDHTQRWPAPLPVPNASARHLLIDQDELKAMLPALRENHQALALLATLALADQQTGQFEITVGDMSRTLGYGDNRRQWSDLMKGVDDGKIASGEQMGHTRRVTLRRIFVPIFVTNDLPKIENVTDFVTNSEALALSSPTAPEILSQKSGQAANFVPNSVTKADAGGENVTNSVTKRPSIYIHTTQPNPSSMGSSMYSPPDIPAEPVKWLLDYLAKEAGFNIQRWREFPLFHKATLRVEEIADVVATVLWAKQKDTTGVGVGKLMGWALKDLNQVPERRAFRDAAYSLIATNWTLVKCRALSSVAV